MGFYDDRHELVEDIVSWQKQRKVICQIPLLKQEPITHSELQSCLSKGFMNVFNSQLISVVYWLKDRIKLWVKSLT